MKRTKKSPRRRRPRHAASAVAPSVDAFHDELARLDRELDEAILASEERAASQSVLDRWLAGAGLPDVARLLERFEKARGSGRADEFGLDSELEELVKRLFVFLYERYWHVRTTGLEHVPDEGPALVVANHSGAMFPYDGAMLKIALLTEHPAARELRPLVDDFVFRAPFLAALMARVGGVRASPENAERLLRRGDVVGVFPEGVRGMGKPFAERYRLQRFGRGGFVAVALRTSAPIVPTAVVGAEDVHPLLGTLTWPAKLVGLPCFPLTPTFPWLGLLGLVPRPSRLAIRFGRSIDLSRSHSAEDAEDPALVDRLTEEVRETIQEMVSDAVRERGPALF